MYPNTTSMTQCYLLGITSREQREKEFCLVRMECRQSCLSHVYHQISANFSDCQIKTAIISNFSLCKQWLATLERTSLHLFVHERSLKALSIYLCMEICAKYYLACPIEFGT